MALKPSYNDKLHLPGLSKTEILILALEASQKLEWNIEEVTPEGARFEVPFNMYSHGEEITFTIEPESDGEVAVRSQSSSVQFVDYGKNRKNIQKLRETMEEIKTSLTPEELTQKAKDFEEECNRPLTEEEKAYLEEEKKRNSFWSFFIPRKGFMATPILIDLNILVFIVMIASGVGSDLQLHTHRCFSSPDEYVCLHVCRSSTGRSDRKPSDVHVLFTDRTMFGSIQSLYARRDNQCRSLRSYLRTLRYIPRLPVLPSHRKGTTESVIDQYPYFCRLQSGLWHESWD